jgi:hypothetical protein
MPGVLQMLKTQVYKRLAYINTAPTKLEVNPATPKRDNCRERKQYVRL